MYLKSIEMQGFKSFADKIRLEFNDGVTGIVGPNGSGKSNIADAVRWVLGEQSARQLRGSNMQDVIFSGTETRKAVSYASVTLTLDNSDRSLSVDYDDVIVSRKVYRSGESEYALNGSLCRLKDIQELFYDTGIGKEGYSIIGQGQIDAILSGKPEERRELFDEAAGIVKFKKRKAIANKKLENEHLNRLRVNDILQELEKQVGPLERQAEKARKYLNYRDECRYYDLQMFARDEELNEKKEETLKSRRAILEEDMAGNREKTEANHALYDELLEKSRVLEEEILAIQEERSGKNVGREHSEGQIRLLKEQQSHLEEEEARNVSRCAEIEEQLKQKDRLIELQKEEEGKLKTDSDSRLDELENLKELLAKKEEEIKALGEKLSEGQGEVLRILNDKASVGARQHRYSAMQEQSAVRKTALTERLLKARTEEETREKEKEKLEQELKEAVSLLGTLKEEQDEILKKEEELVKNREEARERLAHASRQSERTRSQYESLRDIAERYEGFGGSTRRILEQKEMFPGVKGPVSDLVRTEKRYELAMETAIGGALQNIVTEDENTARACIEYLKENKYGRSTFLPLKNIQPKEFGQKSALKEKGVVGVGSDLLEAPKGMEVLPSYLLGNVLVVETMDDGLRIARKYHYDFRIVTLDGDLLNRGGSLTGGSYRSTSNLIGRKRELEELEKSTRKWEEAHRIAKEEEEKASGLLAALRLKKDEVRNSLLSGEMRKKEAEVSRNSLDSVGKNQEEGRNALLSELSMIGQQAGELNRLQEETESSLRSLEEEQAQAEAGNEAIQTDLHARQEERDKLQSQIQEISTGLAGISSQARFLNENVQRLLQEKENLQEEAQICRNAQGVSKKEREQKEAEIKVVSDSLSETQKELDELDQKLSDSLQVRQEYANKQQSIVEERENLTKEAASMEKEALRLEHQSEKLEESMEAEAAYLWNEYGLTPTEGRKEAARIPQEERLEYAALRRRIQEIKNAIRELGNVNVNAIDEYREIHERHQFLKKQHEDLLAAEESLQNVIRELDESMKKRFREKFEEIREEFNRVFRELFGGGKGTLELTDPENLLECGIQIIAQPPGKKLVNMMQMSGGEKALTAISILFAIQNLKPSPFCLLDEIEAALDDANVTRYAEYLKKLTRYTQFITITHRRGTMLAADRLYGITMQEKGISTLVSVNLTEAS